MDFMIGEHSIQRGETTIINLDKPSNSSYDILGISTIESGELASLSLYGPPKDGRGDAFDLWNGRLNLWGEHNTSNSAQSTARFWNFRSLGINSLSTVFNFNSTWQDQPVIGVSTADDRLFYLDWQKDRNYRRGPTNIMCIKRDYEVSHGDFPHAAGSLQGMKIVFPYIYKWWLNTADDSFHPPNYPNLGASGADFNLVIDKLPNNTLPFDRVYILGDSLSDTQNIFNRSAGNLFKGTYYNGRVTNGENWVDQLQRKTGVDVINYAFAGSKINGAKNNSAYETRLCYHAGNTGMPYFPELKVQINEASPAIINDLRAGKKVAIMSLLGGNDYLTGGNFPRKDKKPTTDEVDKVTSNLGAIYSDELNRLYDNLEKELVETASIDIFFLELPPLSSSYAFSNDSEYGAIADYYTNNLNERTRSLLDNRIHALSVNDIMTQITINANSFGLVDGQNLYFAGELDEISDLKETTAMGINNIKNSVGIGIPKLVGVKVTMDKMAPYDASLVNKATTHDGLHPSAKVHDLLLTNLIFQLMSGQWMSDSCDDYDDNRILKNICITEGMTTEIESEHFTELLDYANNATQPRADFSASRAYLTTTYIRGGRYGNNNYSDSPTLTVKTDKSLDFYRIAIFRLRYDEMTMAGGVAGQVKLLVRANACARSSQIEFYSIDNNSYAANYSDENVTFNNFIDEVWNPSSYTGLLSSYVHGGEWLEYDVTTQVKSNITKKSDSIFFLKAASFPSGGDYHCSFFGNVEKVYYKPYVLY